MLRQGHKACEMWGQVATLVPSPEDESTGKVSCATTDRMRQSFVALSSSRYGGERYILRLARFYEAKYVWSIYQKGCQEPCVESGD